MTRTASTILSAFTALTIYAQQPVDRALKVLDAMAGIGKELSTHMTRHTFGNWARGRIPMDVVQQILGHDTISQTQEYMDGFAAPEVQKAMEAFGRAVDEARGGGQSTM